MSKIIIEFNPEEKMIIRKCLSLYWNTKACNRPKEEDDKALVKSDALWTLMQRLDNIDHTIERQVNPLAGQTYYFTTEERRKEFYDEVAERRKGLDEEFIWRIEPKQPKKSEEPKVEIERKEMNVGEIFTYEGSEFNYEVTSVFLTLPRKWAAVYDRRRKDCEAFKDSVHDTHSGLVCNLMAAEGFKWVNK